MTEREPEATLQDLKEACDQRLDAAIRSGKGERRQLDSKRIMERYKTEKGLDIIRYIGRPLNQLLVEYDSDEQSEGQAAEGKPRSVSVFYINNSPGETLVLETAADPDVRGRDMTVPEGQHGRIAAELMQLLGAEE